MKRYGKYLVIALVSFIIIAIGTYAYWSYESSNKKNISISTSKELSHYIVYDEGESKFAGELKVGNSYLDGVHTTISIKKTSEASNVELIATVNMTVNSIGDNIKNSYGLKWAITKGDSTSSGTVLNQGNFYGKNNNDVIELKTGIEVTTTEEKYTVWIWIDGSENINPVMVGEKLDTNVWTQVDQILDNRFEVTSINSNYQFINASAVNTSNDIVAYAVTSNNSQPSSYTNLTTQEQGNVYNVVDYKVSSTGTYYVWFKDSAGNVVNKSVAVSKVDTTVPICTFSEFKPSKIKNGEKSLVELTCVDQEIGIKNSDITTSDISLSSNVVTIDSNIEKTRIANGFKYKITVIGTASDGTSTISLKSGVVSNKADLSNTVTSSSAVTVQNTIGVPIPIQNGTLTYNTASQSPTWNNYDSSIMTLSGTTSGTNAGTYNATFTLKDTTKYSWSDGTKDAKTVSWKIETLPISSPKYLQFLDIADYDYTGSTITPKPYIVFAEASEFGTCVSVCEASTGGTTLSCYDECKEYVLEENKDYTLSYSNNVEVGKATITVTGMGNFSGSQVLVFNIAYKKVMVYQNILSNFSDYSVSGNNTTISYNANNNEYTFTNSSTADPYAEINQQAYLKAGTTYTIYADFKTTSGTKISNNSNIFQVFYKTLNGGYSEDNSVRLTPIFNSANFTPSEDGYYNFRFDNDYGSNMIVYNFSIGYKKEVNYKKEYGTLTSASRTINSQELFVGWYDSTSYANAITSSSIVNNTGSHVVFAKWKLYGTFYYANGANIQTAYSICTPGSDKQCTLTVPSDASNSKAKNNSSYVGVTLNTSSMTSSSLSINKDQTFYAYYRSTFSNTYYIGSTSVSENNSNDYSNTSEWGTRTLYRNVFFSNVSTLNYVISNSSTGVSNLSHGAGISGAAFKGFSGSSFKFATIGTAAESTDTSLTSIYDIWQNNNKGTYYNSLPTAIADASASNTLVLNTTYMEKTGQSVIDKKLYITISSGKILNFGSELGVIPITVRDSAGTITAGDLYLSGTGTIKSNNDRTIYNYGGILQCQNTTISGSAKHITSVAGTVYLGSTSGTNECNITKTDTSNSMSAVIIAGGTLYMYAGTISSQGYGIYSQDTAIVNVYGGNINSVSSAIYSASGSSGYIRIGRVFSNNTTLNPTGISNTTKNRYSSLGKKSNTTNPKIIVTGSGKAAINIYSTSSSGNDVKFRIYHGYIEAASSVVSISANATKEVYIDGGALYSSGSNVYHSQSTSLISSFTGSAHLYSVGYSTVNVSNTLRVNTGLSSDLNGIEESRSDCSGDTGLGRYYGTYIMSQNSYGIYSPNTSGVSVSVGNSAYTQGTAACARYRNEGATIATYKSAFSGYVNLYWYVGTSFHNSSGSSSYKGSNVTKKTSDSTRLHSENSSITSTTVSQTFNGTSRSVSINRKSYPYEPTEFDKFTADKVDLTVKDGSTLESWRGGSSCTNTSSCPESSCNYVGTIKGGSTIYVSSKSSYGSNMYIAWAPVNTSTFQDLGPGYKMARDGANITGCSNYSNYSITTVSSVKYVKVILPLFSGSSCTSSTKYFSEACSELPS